LTYVYFVYRYTFKIAEGLVNITIQLLFISQKKKTLAYFLALFEIKDSGSSPLLN